MFKFLRKENKSYKKRAILFAKSARNGVTPEYKKHLQELNKEDEKFKKEFLED